MVQAKLSTHVDVVVVIIVIVDIVFIVSVVVDVCSNTKKLKYSQREQHSGASTQRLHDLFALSSPQGFTTRSGE